MNVKCITNVTKDGLTDPHLKPGRIYTVVEAVTATMAGEYFTVRLQGTRGPDLARPQAMFTPHVPAVRRKRASLRLEIKYHKNGHQQVTACITMPDNRIIYSDMYNVSPVDAWEGFNRPPVRVLIEKEDTTLRRLNAAQSAAFMRADPVTWTVRDCAHDRSFPNNINPW